LWRLTLTYFPSIIYGYFEIAAKEGDLAGMKGMIMG
jgi:protein transport protein SEC61 subunit alpha